MHQNDPRELNRFEKEQLERVRREPRAVPLPKAGFGPWMLGLMAGLLFTLLLAAQAFAGSHGGDRVLSVGGSVTEIVYALGEEERLVARDTTSSWPEAASQLPNVGYMRALSPEGVLSVNPDIIIAEEGSGPPETIAVLEEADIPFIKSPDGYDRAAVSAKILAVGEALGVADKAEALAAEVDAELGRVADAVASRDGEAPRVMFILSTRGGRVMASGENTAADGIIEMAGAVNAVEGFEGYKQLTDEAIISAAPDVILMMSRGGDHSTENDELFAMPAMTTVPAAETQNVVRLNGLLMLGFGPRTPEAVTKLNDALFDNAS
ncbi:MAG: ABC transporter substrate-binding protein [Pseudomonadota bacterium]